MNGRMRIIGVALGVALLVAAGSAEAGSVDTTALRTTGAGGGEFEFEVVDPFGLFSTGDHFKSFCMERRENLGSGPVTLDDAAHGGGVDNGLYGTTGGTPTNPAGGVAMTNGSGGVGDPLDYRTAWLYARWVGGGLPITYTAVVDPTDGFSVLTSYDDDTNGWYYNSTLSWTPEGEDASDALQIAFWLIEEEISLLPNSIPGVADVDSVLASRPVNNAVRIKAQALDWIALAAAASPTHYSGIEVLNVYQDDGSGNPDFSVKPLQSHLVPVPLPSSVALGMVLLAGMALYGVRRTRSRKW
jgi:hypothetical protein